MLGLLTAIEEASDKIAGAQELKDRDFRSEADDLAKSYSRDKKAYDRKEEKRVAELLECESANRAAIRAELKMKN